MLGGCDSQVVILVLENEDRVFQCKFVYKVRRFVILICFRFDRFYFMNVMEKFFKENFVYGNYGYLYEGVFI